MFLRTNWFGTFLIEGDEVVDHRLFPADPEEIARRYEQCREGELLDEERSLVSELESIEVAEHRLLKLGNTHISEAPEDHPVHTTVPSPEEYNIPTSLLQDALIILASRKLRKTFAGREIIELIAALDDLNRSINLLKERESEWIKVYDNNSSPSIFQSFRLQIHQLGTFREELTDTIREIMKEKNPTLSGLVGELLGARLIALAGGKERLAKLPSSTIQILGAENAFFRFRRTGKGMPKHGIICQHPWIRSAKRKDRGKIARTLAAKIALAVRIDFYSDRDDAEILRNAVEKRIREISGGSGN